jgi:GMP synthase-like glutamine amidotransferase
LRGLIVQNCDVEDLGAYAGALAAQGHECTTIRGDVAARLSSPREWDFVLVGGTPDSATTFESSHPAEWEFLRTAVATGVPCFGVCCGAQVLARLLGARVQRLPAMEMGVYEAALTPDGRDDALFAEFPATFPVFHWHSYAFGLPPGAAHLVTQEGWPLQSFRRGTVAGVLFHLELAPDAVARWVRAYPHELAEFGAESGALLAQVESRAEEMGTLAAQLMRNFCAIVEHPSPLALSDDGG